MKTKENRMSEPTNALLSEMKRRLNVAFVLLASFSLTVLLPSCNKAEETEITPPTSFELQEIIYDGNSAVITEGPDIQIISTSTNTSEEAKPYTQAVGKSVYETSHFIENQGSEKFNVSNPEILFQRPAVLEGKIVLPGNSTKRDATYKTSGTQNIDRLLTFSITGQSPKNCLIEATSLVKTYNVRINYTVKATSKKRNVEFSGVWRGYVISDPKLEKPAHTTRFFDLDTGEEIYIEQGKETNLR